MVRPAPVEDARNTHHFEGAKVARLCFKLGYERATASTGTTHTASSPPLEPLPSASFAAAAAAFLCFSASRSASARAPRSRLRCASAASAVVTPAPPFTAPDPPRTSQVS